MQIDDSHLDNTPDLIAKIRKLREAAEKEMNRFTSIANYEVRRIVGQKPKSDLAEEPSSVAPDGGRARKKTDKSSADQTAIEFSSAPAERDDDGEDQ
jgi:Spy/CpxP family protein refolding chaperone